MPGFALPALIFASIGAPKTVVAGDGRIDDDQDEQLVRICTVLSEALLGPRTVGVNQAKGQMNLSIVVTESTWLFALIP